MAEDFEAFVDEYYRPAYRFAFSLCGKHEEACDLTQQSFYIAQTKGHQLRDTTKRKQWLFTVLHREFLSLRRKATAHPHDDMDLVEHELPQITVDHATAMDGKSVLQVLQALDENFKLPLTLFYLDQLSYKEIAAVLEVPIGTVMSRLSRGKAMLRQRLEQERAGEAGKIVPLPSQALGGANG